jgi:amino acid adenylation domain-containing protein
MADPRFDLTQLNAAEKRALLAELLRSRAPEHPLSYGQRALWFHQKLAPDSAAYTIMFAARITSALDVGLLERALRLLVARHSIFRTTYLERVGQPVQVIHPEASIELEVIAAANWDDEDLAEFLRRRRNSVIDLEKGPMLQAHLVQRESDNILVLTIAHIAMDNWSLDIVIDDLRAAYDAGAGADVALPPAAAAQYVDYARLQSKMLSSDEGEALWNYWRQALCGNLPKLQLPTDRPRPSTLTYRGDVHEFSLTPELTALLGTLARDRGVTMYVIILSAYLVLLHRYSAQNDICVGSPMADREWTEFSDVVGYFANPVVLRPDMTGNPTFGSLLDRVRQNVLDAAAHQQYPFARLVEQLQPERDLAYSPIFQASLVWEKDRRVNTAGSARRGDLQIEPIAFAQGGAPVELMLICADRGTTIWGTFHYNCDLFDPKTIERMASHLTRLLESAVASPDQHIDELGLLTDAEQRQQLLWNATNTNFVGEQMVHHLVEAQVVRTPDSIAVEFGNQQLTYEELNGRADELAHRLRNHGVERNALVGVYMHRSIELVVSLLAVLKAGGAFVPVDPGHPEDRLAKIVDDASAVCWLTNRALRDTLPTNFVLCADSLDSDDSGDPSTVGSSSDAGPDDLAYAIYTSGSTGQPKGVLNTHRGLRNRLLWMLDTYRFDVTDRFLQKTPITFDVALWEVFTPLIAGAVLVIAEPGGHRDTDYLTKTVLDRRVTVIHFVPSMLHAFLADPQASRCTSLRHVFCSGEALTANLRDAFFSTFASAELHNLYGPTEASIEVSYYDCVRGLDDAVVPIGRPIANTQLHVLDTNRQPVPIGIRGELYIGGVGVAKGYLNQPRLTSENFVPDHFSDDASLRLYRTGDLARYRSDGTIEYLGRMDRQVKVRGVRVELGEVEAAFERHPGLRQCVVAARDESVGHSLVAYVVPTAQHAPNTSELRRFLATILPDAMIPSTFVVLEELPLTSSGKVDHKSLPSPEHERPSLDVDYVAPRNNEERTLSQIWAEVLDVERVGVNDNFFDLGGASALSLEVVSRARLSGFDLSPESLFRHPTVAGLAAAARNGSDGELVGEPPNGVVVRSGGCPMPAPVRNGSDARRNVVIESLGVYLPTRTVTTAEILDGCTNPVLLPLEQLTGIRDRRFAGEGEYSIDMTKTAVERCLELSQYTADMIDLLLCCNVSRSDAPMRMVLEPSCAARLESEVGFKRAVSFDVMNACAGVFTGIAVAEAFLRTQGMRTAMVVSGEYLSDLTATAQAQIADFLDDRLACLTLGDAAVALILELGPDDATGFHALDMSTFSRYSSLCVAKASDHPTGGIVMHTDAVNLTAVTVKTAVPYAADVLRRNRWNINDVDHIVMHQTSDSSITDACVAINKFYGANVASNRNIIRNLAHRGNTASTTHFVAIDDYISNGRIRPGDRALFSITGSGQTIGAALYTFDDLPERIRSRTRKSTPANGAPNPAQSPPASGVRITQVSTASPDSSTPHTAVDLAARAAAACLDASLVRSEDIGLLIYAGIYRDEFICEPALAALVAAELNLDDASVAPSDSQTLAFDVANGALGFLNGCYTATAMLCSGRASHALIVASEVNPVGGIGADNLPGIQQMGSAAVLSYDDKTSGRGFGRFLFTHHSELLSARTSYAERVRGGMTLRTRQDNCINDHLLTEIPNAVEQLLELEGLTLDDIDMVLPPQISAVFVEGLRDRLKIPADRIAQVKAAGLDYFTSSIPATLEWAHARELVRPGDTGLIIAVGTGVQIGCATYHF